MAADHAHPHVAVIGSGISGLTAGKMLKDYGVRYTMFETSDRIGGNWAFGNPNGHSSAYRSLHFDTSKHRLSFKDFPMPEHFPSFPHHSQVKACLDDFASAFGLLGHIEFGNGVVHASRRPEGGWHIRDQAGAKRSFDLLVVANGHHWDPRTPEFPGMFTGETMHSHHYIDPTAPLELTGKRILVVGIGNSAADITVELSSKALRNQVTLSTRSSAWIALKYIAGRPGDMFWRTSPHLPLSWQRKAVQLVAPMLGTDPTMYGLPPANHKLFEAHPTQSVELPLRRGSGDVTPKPNVSRLDGRFVQFDDGTSDEFDVIIHATGYNISFPFFDPEFINAPDNHIRLYKRMFKPGIDDVVFIGFAQSVPTLFPFVECQSRLLAAYAIGRYALPCVAEMERTIDADQQLHAGHCTDRPRHTQQVDYFVYEHDLRKRELPADRIALWGASFWSGHVLRVAAERDDIGAIVALTPLTSGMAVGRAAALSGGPRALVSSLRWTLTGVKSRIAAGRGQAPTLMPLVSQPGGAGALGLDGAYESYLSLAGATWRNEIDCAIGLEVVRVRSTAAAKRLRCPLLVQIADFDRYVPAGAVAATAEHGRAQVHRYPCDHFDVWPGHDWFDKTVGGQVAFLERTLRVQ